MVRLLRCWAAPATPLAIVGSSSVLSLTIVPAATVAIPAAVPPPPLRLNLSSNGSTVAVDDEPNEAVALWQVIAFDIAGLTWALLLLLMLLFVVLPIVTDNCWRELLSNRRLCKPVVGFLCRV